MCFNTRFAYILIINLSLVTIWSLFVHYLLIVGSVFKLYYSIGLSITFDTLKIQCMGSLSF